jgi:hypothetical protein
MPRIAISGHRGLPAPVQQLIDRAIRAALDGLDDVTGLSCLADGPDQIFARAVLDHGGRIEAIIPAALYRDGLPADAHAEYDWLLTQAVTAHRLPFTQSTSEAHMAASELMIKHAGQLWAVWDGLPARGYGGTADVVTAARASGLPVRVIWPQGAHRD